MVAQFQSVTHHSWHPLHDTIRMQINIPATIVIAAPHDRWILEKLPTKEAAMPCCGQVKGVDSISGTRFVIMVLPVRGIVLAYLRIPTIERIPLEHHLPRLAKVSKPNLLNEQRRFT